MLPQNQKAQVLFLLCSPFAPLADLHFLCQVKEEVETVQRQLKPTPSEIEGITHVSPNLEFSDFVRYAVYESALQNEVLLGCK